MRLMRSQLTGWLRTREGRVRHMYTTRTRDDHEGLGRAGAPVRLLRIGSPTAPHSGTPTQCTGQSGGIGWTGPPRESGAVSDHEAATAPEYMNGWSWADPRWREWTGADPAKLVLEAIRRAVDIRDTNADETRLSARPVMLV